MYRIVAHHVVVEHSDNVPVLIQDFINLLQVSVRNDSLSGSLTVNRSVCALLDNAANCSLSSDSSDEAIAVMSAWRDDFTG